MQLRMEFASVGLVVYMLLWVVVVVQSAVAAPAAEREGMQTQPAFGQEPSPRTARDASGGFVTLSLILNFTSAEEFGGSCLAGRTAGLGDTTLTLEQRFPDAAGDESEWKVVQSNVSLDYGHLEFTVQRMVLNVFECTEYRLVQEEHGGGSCNCWSVTRPAIGTSQMNETFVMCNTTASQRRIFSCTYCLDGGNVSADCTDMPEPEPPRQKPFNISESCSNATSHLNVDFQIIFNGNSGCNTVTNFNEAVEFSLLLDYDGDDDDDDADDDDADDDGVWIPLAVIFRGHGAPNGITLGDQSNLVIRDYSVDKLEVNESDLVFNVSLQLCNFKRDASSIQFRWLQTSRFGGGNITLRDLWGLDDLKISYIQEDGMEEVVLSESFDSNQLNSTIWPLEGIRDANLSTNCTVDPNDQALVFGLASNQVNITQGQRFRSVASRIIKTAPLPITITAGTSTMQPESTPASMPTESTSDGTAAMPTESTSPASMPTSGPESSGGSASTPVTTDPTSTEDPLLKDAAELLMNADLAAREAIYADPVLRAINNAPPHEAITLLQAVLDNNTRQDDPFAVVYLFSSILNRTQNQLPINETIRVASSIIRRTRRGRDQAGMALNIVGASLLNSMDTFLFDHFDEERSLMLNDIGVRSKRFLREAGEGSGLQVAINSTRPSRMVIEFPRELIRNVFRDFPNQIRNSSRLRFGSFVYEDTTGIVPNILPGRNGTELASGIVSTAIQCKTGRCATETLGLEKPVRITIQHSSMVQERLERDNDSEVLCVFLNFPGGGASSANILSVGYWSQEECWRNENLSNSSVTVCECTHLTHFAILLSARPLPIPDDHRIALEIIGYVGVAISLAAMIITILSFVALKALHTMRNYIHINLCVNLGIAQVIFVAGVDKVGGGEESVPAHCRAVAVLLHYFFLVSFMWMLMEGVVLYVVLVKVFVKRKKLYMLAFTVASYGAPLLYLGLLTLPLGFALPRAMPSYGYQEACFLNPGTYFIWAFIAPVLLIFLANFGFFIMATSIMWRHQKKQTGDKSNLTTLKSWLKAAVSLVVIMGLTWIVGVVIVEVEELLFVAYIYTFMAAFQGLFIFVIFVLLSKSVREAYGKWWRTKVNESDCLGKYFGEKFTLPTTSSRTASGSKDRKGSSNSKAQDYKLEHSEHNLISNTYTRFDAMSPANGGFTVESKVMSSVLAEDPVLAEETKERSPETNGGLVAGKETKQCSSELNGGPTVEKKTKEGSPEEEEEVGSITSATKIDLGEEMRRDELAAGKSSGGKTGSEQIAYMIMKRLPNKSTDNSAL